MDSNHQLSIDFDKNSADLSISKDIYLRILDKGIAQTQLDMPQLDKFIEEENADEIKQITHRLKGDFYNMRIDPLSSLAKQMEDIAKSHMNKDELKILLNDFKNLLEQLSQKAKSSFS